LSGLILALALLAVPAPAAGAAGLGEDAAPPANAADALMAVDYWRPFTPPNWTDEPDQAKSDFGSSVGTAGDMNGDGFGELIPGAPWYDSDQADRGGAFLHLGDRLLCLHRTAHWTAFGQAGSRAGASVAGAGDVNGDGYGDVLVGIPYFDGGKPDEGRVELYYGNGGAGLALAPRQRRVSDRAPIGPLGASDRSTAFRLALQGRTPFGRGKVKLEWEAKPLGTRFDGMGLGRSAAWLDSGVAGVQLSDLVQGLAANKLYIWRVRVRYQPASVPFQAAGRWLYGPWNSGYEADLRLLARDYADLFLPFVNR
jgi:hypothetical protein